MPIKKPKMSFRMALALMFTASAGAVAVATPAQAQDQANYDRFARSNYTYCDAKMIGSLFGTDAYRGKIIIGQKIGNGLGGNIIALRTQSWREGNRCDYSDLPKYSYDDIALLTRYWGVNAARAKSKAVDLYLGGREDAVRTAVHSSALDVFARSGFTFCDAKLVGAYHGDPIYEAKIFIGAKVAIGSASDIDWYVRQSYQRGNRC